MAEHLHALLDALAPAARRLRCARELAAARTRIDDPAAERARAAGPQDLARELADRFEAECAAGDGDRDQRHSPTRAWVRPDGG
jgi:hypothetical protein